MSDRHPFRRGKGEILVLRRDVPMLEKRWWARPCASAGPSPGQRPSPHRSGSSQWGPGILPRKAAAAFKHQGGSCLLFRFSIKRAVPVGLGEGRCGPRRGAGRSTTGRRPRLRVMLPSTAVVDQQLRAPRRRSPGSPGAGAWVFRRSFLSGQPASSCASSVRSAVALQRRRFLRHPLGLGGRAASSAKTGGPAPSPAPTPGSPTHSPPPFTSCPPV